MVGIAELGRAAAGAGGMRSPVASGDGGTPFAGVMQSLMAASQDASTKAEGAVKGLMDGSGGELHEAMIATQKADIAFELALQVRNKAVSAYQQMMSMQF